MGELASGWLPGASAASCSRPPRQQQLLRPASPRQAFGYEPWHKGRSQDGQSCVKVDIGLGAEVPISRAEPGAISAGRSASLTSEWRPKRGC